MGYLDPDDFREDSENTWTRGARLSDAEAPDDELADAIDEYSRLFDRATNRAEGYFSTTLPVPGLVQHAVALLVADHFHEWNPDQRRASSVRSAEVEYDFARTSPTGLPEVDEIIAQYREPGTALTSIRIAGDYDSVDDALPLI